jgi:hypothetical protein
MDIDSDSQEKDELHDDISFESDIFDFYDPHISHSFESQLTCNTITQQIVKPTE